MAEQIDCAVIGAGVVGLACARALARAGREVVLLERHRAIGLETSSRNSEVVHAGLYYPQGSLKARLCVAGRRALYAYCEARGIAHRKCGKLIAATRGEDVARLEALYARGRANGVERLRLLTKAEAQALEPALECEGALSSPETGILDSHQFMLALAGDLEAAGGVVAFGAEILGGAVLTGGVELEIGGDQAAMIRARSVVNAAGLAAPVVARRLAGFPGDRVPRLRFAKGRYFSYAGAAPFSRLIYPLPEPGGLGIHVTLDLAGRARLGPDVVWDVAPEDVTVEASARDAFCAGARAYWPSLDCSRLQPDYAGVRPKLSGPGEPPADFRIDGPAAHGVPGLVHLYGIESPGLTAALAIGDYAARLLDS